MTDWETCPAVERRPGKLNGAWTFAGTRVPVSALFENLGSGATVEQFLDWFPGVEEWKVRAVLQPPNRRDPYGPHRDTTRRVEGNPDLSRDEG